MSEHVYKVVEIVGSSQNGYQEAIENAIAKASKTVRNMGWFTVSETRGQIEDDEVAYWQVTVKIGFRIDE